MNEANGRAGRLLLSPWWLAALLCAALLVLPWSSWQRLELLVHDGLAGTLPAPAPSGVVVVAIDDASLAELGPWPWPRRLHAAMIDRLRGAGSGAVAYDVLFADDGPPAGEPELAAALRRHGRVVLPLAPAVRPARAGVATLMPLPPLAKAARALGHVDVELDVDAVARRLYLQGGDIGNRWPALPLALAQIDGGPPLAQPLPGLQRATAAFQGDGWIRNQEVLLPHSHFDVPELSFRQVLRDDALAATLRGQTVLVGVTATGLGAPLATTVAGSQAQMPAVQFLARAYAALRDGMLLTPLSEAANWLLVLPVCLLGALLALRQDSGPGLVPALLPALPPLLSLALMHFAHRWYDPLPGSAALLVAWLAWRGNPLREARRHLFRTRQQAHATLLAITEGVVTVDSDLRVRLANPAARQMLQHALPDGMAIEALGIPDGHPPRLAEALRLSMSRQTAVEVEGPLEVMTPQGRRVLRATATPVLDDAGRSNGAVLALGDVTEVEVAHARLNHEATHDGLTGLPNRAMLQEHLRRAIATARRGEQTVALMFVDLDRFKRVNDSLGHRQGDRVLLEVAARLRHLARASDLVARWGGDEFVLILQGLKGREQIAGAARRMMQSVAAPFEVDGIGLEIGCSIGIALAPEDSEDADQLLAMADLAMYRSRNQAGTHLAFYSGEMTLWTRDRLEVENQLRHALAAHQFELHYQPQVSLDGGQPVALEALLRWRRGDGRLALPGEFIGVAEDCGLIIGIGAWVIGEAARQIAAWQALGLTALPVAVNVSARQCVDFGVVATLQEALTRTGIDPALLTLEVTETAAMTDVEHVVQLMQQVRALGVGVAVDDFGTGYTSLAYLTRFPLSQIKVDQRFVRDVASDPSVAAVVAAIVALSHSLGLPVVGEGVETPEQRDVLARQGCDLAQGYLYSRVLAPDHIEALLRSR